MMNGKLILLALVVENQNKEAQGLKIKMA